MTASPGSSFASAFNQAAGQSDTRRANAASLAQNQAQFQDQQKLERAKLAQKMAAAKGETLDKQLARNLTDVSNAEKMIAEAVKTQPGFLENPTAVLNAYEATLARANATLDALGQPNRTNMFKSIVQGTATPQEAGVAQGQTAVAAAPGQRNAASIAARGKALDARTNAPIVGKAKSIEEQASAPGKAIAAATIKKAELKAEAAAKSKNPDPPTNSDLGTFRAQYNKFSDPFRAIRGSFETILNLPNDGPSDVSRIVAYVKIFDPTSIVRESEGKTVVDSTGQSEKFRASMNKLLGSGTLTEGVRKKLAESAATVFKARLEEQRRMGKQWRDKAQSQFGDAAKNATFDYVSGSDQLLERVRTNNYKSTNGNPSAANPPPLRPNPLNFSVTKPPASGASGGPLKTPEELKKMTTMQLLEAILAEERAKKGGAR